MEKVSAQCPGCHANKLFKFYEVRDVPVHGTSIMVTKQEALTTPKGDVVLCFCSQCGFINNIAYEQSLLGEIVIYEDQQGFSPTFLKYINKLSEDLIEKYDLRNKSLVEIGCGKGDFLKILCERGNNSGIGIDPIAGSNRIGEEISQKLTFVKEYFKVEHASYIDDFICCRHTLEHIHLPFAFLRTIREAIGENPKTILFIEVPDIDLILSEIAFWDLYYEHCSYFTKESLTVMLARSGFEAIEAKTVYSDQYIIAEARPKPASINNATQQQYQFQDLNEKILSFASELEKLLSTWQRRIKDFNSRGKKIVIWGSGSKCVAFLSTLGIDKEIEYIIDINPHRHGRFIPGSGKEIKAPEFLQEYKPDLVIVMNAIYTQEIQDMLDDLDVATEVLAT